MRSSWRLLSWRLDLFMWNRIRLLAIKWTVNSCLLKDVYQFILMQALFVKDVGRAIQLIQTGIAVNEKKKFKFTYGNYYLEYSALKLATENQILPVVHELLEHGAHVDITDSRRRTPLSYAAMNGNEAIVAALITAGADVNHEDYELETPLTEAAKAGHVQCVRRLVEAGADIDHRSNKRTALEWAVAEGNAGVVAYMQSWFDKEAIDIAIRSETEFDETAGMVF